MPEEEDRDPNIHVIMVEEVELPGGQILAKESKVELEWVQGGGKTLGTEQIVIDRMKFIHDPDYMKKVPELRYYDEVDDMPLTVVSIDNSYRNMELVYMVDRDNSTISIPVVSCSGLNTFLIGQTYLIEGDVRSSPSGHGLAINLLLVRNTDGSLPPRNPYTRCI